GSTARDRRHPHAGGFTRPSQTAYHEQSRRRIPPVRAIQKIVSRRTPRSGKRTTYSCARPNEWCTLTTEEEDKRELRVSSKDETYRSPFISMASARSMTGLDAGL